MQEKVRDLDQDINWGIIIKWLYTVVKGERWKERMKEWTNEWMNEKKKSGFSDVL
jgi:hypothetical protein